MTASWRASRSATRTSTPSSRCSTGRSRTPARAHQPRRRRAAIQHFARVARAVYASPAVKRYVLALVTQTREHPGLKLGASPRTSIQLLRAAKAVAAMAGRDHVLPDDVQLLAQPVLAHRLILSTESRLAGRTTTHVVASVVERTPIPVYSSTDRR
ncbi:MoxR family ATPase [Oerskovia sp. M15]